MLASILSTPQMSNRIHRSYVRCRVLSVRESFYHHPLPNSARVVERPQKVLICLERPRRGAQHRDDQGMEDEELSTWDGRSEARKRRIMLREEWTATRVEEGDYVHCVGNWDEEEMSSEDSQELERCEDREQSQRQQRDHLAEQKPFCLMTTVTKAESEEEKTPPSSFDSDASLFANVDENQLLASDQLQVPKILTMYLSSASPISEHRHADNLLILHPDTLVTATAVCDVPTCIRKPLIKQRINGSGATDKMSEALVMGNMLHEVLQACLTGMGLDVDSYTSSLVPDCDSQESLLPYLSMPFPLTWFGPGRTNFSLPFVLRQVKLQVLKNLDGLLCCNLETTAGEEKLLELCRPFGEFARKYLEDTFEAYRAENLGQQIHGLFRGRNGMMNMAGIFKEDAVVVDSRTTVPTLARVTHVFDVEEEIWSPMYGLKGKIDVSVEVEMQETYVERPAWRGGNHYQPDQAGDRGQDKPQPQTSFYRCTQSTLPAAAPYKTRSSSIMPLEIKTGKSVDALEHRAQTMLYTLIMSDRYGTDVTSGLLYYTRSGDMHHVRRTRNEVRGLIVGRNELAYWMRRNASSNDYDERVGHLREELSLCEGGDRDVALVEEAETVLPPTIDHERECKRCFAQEGCMLYRRAIDRIVEDPENPSEVAGLYDRITAHLTPQQASFYAKWEHLLSLEENDMIRFKRELWTMTATAREETGRCFANMVMDPRQPDMASEVSGGQVNAHVYRFVRDTVVDSLGPPLFGGNMSPGDPCVVSIEPNMFSVAQGYIVHVNSHSVLVGLDHHLDAILERAAIEQGKSLTANSLDVTFRIDRDEYSDGMAKIRFALSRFFFSTLPRDQRHRELIVDLAPPRYKPEDTVLTDDEMPAHLNQDQRRAMRKVLAAEDYALILGMPGTGKTTTVAELIHLLVARGNTILLASYTHSAVDTILRKLLQLNGVNVLRLGNVDRVHPDLQHCTLPRTSTVEELNSVINAPNVIGTTCLSTGHATFARRKFDYCIIDEASQITLPSTLGSLRFADKFVLVGDHYQLPPLVRNITARAGGLNVSLFKRLHEAHASSTVYLTKQYRMNKNIMLISNELIYQGKLQCGSEQVAKQTLDLPTKELALNEVHQASPDTMSGHRAIACCSDEADGYKGCWLAKLLDEKCQAAFVDTDDVPGYESKHGRMVQNTVEASIVQQVVRMLVLAGVPPNDIAVITPYRQQLKLLQHLLITPRSLSQQAQEQDVSSRKTAAQIKREAMFLGTSSNAGDDIEILTADRSQGRDKPVVLISLVRSNDYGTRGIGELLNDWRRINVALTRAQRKVVIIGSQRTLGAAPLLVDFFNLMKEQDWIYKLPPFAVEMHPAAAQIPTSPNGLLVLAKKTKKRCDSEGRAETDFKRCFVAADLRRPETSADCGAMKEGDRLMDEKVQPLSQTNESELNIRYNLNSAEAKWTEDTRKHDIKTEFVDLRDEYGTFASRRANASLLGKRKKRTLDATSPTSAEVERTGNLLSGDRVKVPAALSSLASAEEVMLRNRHILRDALQASQKD